MSNLQGRRFTGWIAALCLFAAPAIQAKSSKIDLSPFRGNYSCVWTIGTEGRSLPAKVTVNITGPKNGSKITVNISGVLLANGSATGIVTSFVMDNKRNVTGTEILMGYDGPVATLPTKFSGSKNKFAFALTSVPGAIVDSPTSTATMFYTLQFRKSSFTISGSGVLGEVGISLPAAISVIGHKKS